MTTPWEVALVSGLVGLAFLFIRGLIVRAIMEQDKNIQENKASVLAAAATTDGLKDRIVHLEGTLDSSWGLVSAVKKLDGNVEQLTRAVDRISATVEVLTKQAVAAP